MQRVLVVSPHLDDAVLSIGGHLARLAASGSEVLVLTVFAGIPQPSYSPVAELLHTIWDLAEEPVERRRREDGAALALLGVGGLHAEFLDVIYRVDETGAWLIQEGERPTTAGPDDEPELVAAISGWIRESIAGFRPTRVLTCAALGDHVDHRRTRDAVVSAVGADDGRLAFWADLPYTVALPKDAPQILTARRLHCEILDDDTWKVKVAAVGCYRSQHSMLWPDTSDFRSAMDDQATHLASLMGQSERCELLWDAPEETGENQARQPR